MFHLHIIIHHLILLDSIAFFNGSLHHWHVQVSQYFFGYVEAMYCFLWRAGIWFWGASFWLAGTNHVGRQSVRGVYVAGWMCSERQVATPSGISEEAVTTAGCFHWHDDTLWIWPSGTARCDDGLHRRSHGTLLLLSRVHKKQQILFKFGVGRCVFDKLPAHYFSNIESYGNWNAPVGFKSGSAIGTAVPTYTSLFSRMLDSCANGQRFIFELHWNVHLRNFQLCMPRILDGGVIHHFHVNNWPFPVVFMYYVWVGCLDFLWVHWDAMLLKYPDIMQTQS